MPKKLFKNPKTTVVTSSNDKLLGALISKDGQWRFPESDSLSPKIKTCILQFEDEYFYYHFGFNPISIFKALKQNLKAKKVKRGGSTITQQVIRLSRKNRKRSYFEKIIELVLSTRLEFRNSKDKILNLYLSHAPFGGNVVGIETASWRYFNRSSFDLSWAESATLAVLPNAPSLIYPGKNKEKLLNKRNRLLKKLLENKKIDSLTYNLSILEDLPKKPYPLPQVASHLVQEINQNHSGRTVKTTINFQLQNQTNEVVKNHFYTLKQNQINNIAVLVLDVKNRNVLAYVGNSPTTKEHQKDVNIINKPRSTGSILKPFLYACVLDDGQILPHSLVPDIPTQYGNYSPENYFKTYDGAVPASEALSRSLNVPAVRMLQSFGLERFHYYLNKLNLKDIKKSPQHYGLSIILGGAESNLWDLCKSYAGLASTVNHFTENSGQYFSNEFCEPNLLFNNKINFGELKFDKNIFDAASIYFTLESLKKVNRPTEQENWELFDSSKQIAWKTGTSFGFRDAWAIGTTKDYVVGVWVGNADGEGRPGLVGIETAAPIMFDVFGFLPKSKWFEKPYDAISKAVVCNQSGYLASQFCSDTSKVEIPTSGLKSKPCPYHKLVHLDKSEKYRVNSSCELTSEIIHKPWFILPPLQAFFYKNKNPFYKDLPPIREDCISESIVGMEFIYPNNQTKIFLPKDFDGKTKGIVLKVAHSKPELELYWYLDNVYLGSTKEIHELNIIPETGKHLLSVTDELGNTIYKRIKIVK